MKTPNINKSFNPTDLWLDSVAYSHSGSKRTEFHYRRNFSEFLCFIGKTADGIKTEYEASTDRVFRRRYAEYLRAWIASLSRRDYANSTIKVMVAAVKSFFKYNDLPLGFVPVAAGFVVYHNRDLTKEEIAHILSVSRPRDKAFYTVMAQSGLRPITICQLRLKHLEPDLSNGTIPCKIQVPREIAKGKYQGHFTFIGAEAVEYLRDYLKKRANVTPESYVFTKHGTEEPVSTKSPSVIFNKTIRKLRAKGLLDYEQKQKGKPAEIRLYNLRKFFRKMAHQAGFEFVQFWMGHVVKEGVDEHYRPKDDEFHRKLYAEKAMPYLRLETATPSETEKSLIELKQQLAQKDEQISTLQQTMQKMKPVIDFVNGFKSPEQLERFFETLKQSYILSPGESAAAQKLRKAIEKKKKEP